MRNFLLVASVLLLLSSRPALAGPSSFPQLVCRDQVGLVTVIAIDGKRAQLRLDGDYGLSRRGDGRYDPEGSYLEPALITAPKGTLAVGERFVAALEPPAGAQCATTAAATRLVPIAWLGAIAALLH